MSNFSFSHSVFFPVGELSAIFIKFEIVVCKLFQFGRVQNFIVWERVKTSKFSIRLPLYSNYFPSQRIHGQARPLFLLRIDDSHWDWIHSSLIAVLCFDDGYVGKQPEAWKEYCAEYWLKRSPGKYG